MAAHIGGNLGELRRLGVVTRGRIVGVIQVQRVVVILVPMCHVPETQNKGQGKVIKLLGGYEVKRKGEPLLVVLHVDNEQLMPNVARC